MSDRVTARRPQPITFTRASNILIIIIALTSIVRVFRSATAEYSFEGGMLGVATRGDRPYALRRLESLDSVIRSAFPEKGNIIASFPSMMPGNSMDQAIASDIAQRATYLMWPRRMYLGDARTLIRGGSDLLSAPRPTDPKWLAVHDVRAIVEFGFQDGRVTVTSEAVPVSPQ